MHFSHITMSQEIAHTRFDNGVLCTRVTSANSGCFPPPRKRLASVVSSSSSHRQPKKHGPGCPPLLVEECSEENEVAQQATAVLKYDGTEFSSPSNQGHPREESATPRRVEEVLMIPQSRCVLNPREKLQKHCLQVAGKVQIPDVWGGEERLHEWISTEDVEEALRPPDLLKARAALVGGRSNM